MLIKGRWAEDFQPVHDTDEKGGFLRDDAGFRNWITKDGRPGPSGEGGFAAEPGRYHLYVALICPWASRTLMARVLEGLKDVVSVTVLDPRLTEKVWRFGGTVDPDHIKAGYYSIRALNPSGIVPAGPAVRW